MAWQPTQPIDFTEDGDTTSVAIKKHDTDISVIYDLLQRVRIKDWGENPPSDAVQGHIWECKTENLTGLKIFYNGQWQQISGIYYASSESALPSASDCLDGTMFIVLKNGNYTIFFAQGGSWVQLLEYGTTGANNLLQLANINNIGLIDPSLTYQRDDYYNPSSNIDLEIGKRIRLYNTNVSILDLKTTIHVIEYGIYRIVMGVHSGDTTDKSAYLQIGKQDWTGKVKGIRSLVDDVGNEENIIADTSKVSGLWIGAGATWQANIFLTVRPSDKFVCISNCFSETVYGKTRGHIFYMSSVPSGASSQTTLGQIVFPDAVDVMLVVERIR